MERYSIDNFILDERELAEHYKESGNEDGYKGKSKLVEFLEELKSYKKAEENGMLKHLPAKRGGKVYAYKPFFGLLEYEVAGIYIGEKIMFSCVAFSEQIGEYSEEVLDERDFELEHFGKVVFVTREQAKQSRH